MNKIVQVIIQFAINLIFNVFSPIDNYILINIPVLNVPISYINNFLTWLKDFVLWVLSWLPFNSNIWSWFIDYLIVRVSISAFVSIFKLAIKWWHYIVP